MTSLFKNLFTSAASTAATETVTQPPPQPSPEKQEDEEQLPAKKSAPRATGKAKYKEVTRERRLGNLRTWEDQRKSRPAPEEGKEKKKKRRVNQQTRFREKQRYYTDPKRGGVEGFSVKASRVEKYVRSSATQLSTAEEGTPFAAIAEINQVTSFRSGFYEIVQAFFDDHANEIVEIAAANARRARNAKEGSGVVCFKEDITISIDHIVTCRNQ